MREIKFRVWHNGLKYIGIPSIGSFNDINDEISNHQEDGYTWMQYTGLKDKNGVEIYEGDIVKGNYLRGIGEIKWNDKFCKFDISHRMNISPSDEFEVIGNIYENPELLE